MQYRHDVDTSISNAILKKGTRGSFHLWAKDDYLLTVTILQKPHTLGASVVLVDTERPRANVSQGCYDNSFLGIGRIFTPRGTETLAPESTSS